MIEIRKYLFTEDEKRIIFQRMKDMKISQREMAEMLNMSGHSNIGDYIRGRVLISEDIMIKMLKILKLDLKIEHDISISQVHQRAKWYT